MNEEFREYIEENMTVPEMEASAIYDGTGNKSGDFGTYKEAENGQKEPDFDKKSKKNKRESLVKIEFYGAISLLVGLFALIYNHFGHGVHSIFMSYSWGIPFFALIWYACMFAINAKISLISRETLGAAVATLTLASIIEGILVIAGTSSIYVLPMAIIGGLLLIFALIVQLVSLGHKSKSHS